MKSRNYCFINSKCHYAYKETTKASINDLRDDFFGILVDISWCVIEKVGGFDFMLYGINITYVFDTLAASLKNVISYIL